MKNDKKTHASLSSNIDSDDGKERLNDQPPMVSEQILATQEFISSYTAAPYDQGFVQNVMHSIQSDVKQRPAVIHTMFSPRILRYAATVLILLAVGFVLWSLPKTHAIPGGTRSTLVLADGSTVLMNSGSTLTYQRFWGRSERRVLLKGEAFFDVSKSDKPFIVETENAEIRVLGTRFSVKSWPGSKERAQTQVTLEEGKVSVAAKATPGATHEMSPNESFQVSGVTQSTLLTPHSSKETEILLSWREGGYVFQNALLYEVVDELSRRTNNVFKIPAELQALPVTYINPKPVSAEAVLDDLSMALSFTYRQNANGYELIATPAPIDR